MAAATVAAVVSTSITTPVTAGIAVTGAVAIFAWLGFIDFQEAAPEFFTIKLIDSCRSLGVSGHLDERESSGAPGVAVFHDTGAPRTAYSYELGVSCLLEVHGRPRFNGIQYLKDLVQRYTNEVRESC